MPERTDPNRLVDHFFRHESARLTAALTRRLGIRHLQLAEDAVQVALSRALASWSLRGPPDQPAAWLWRVASNHAIDTLRRESKQSSRDADELAALINDRADSPTSDADEELDDHLLRMIFVCCDPLVPMESQSSLALKTLCGFSVEEIARALVSRRDGVIKRITRAKARLRDSRIDLSDINADQIRQRLPDVQRVVYLIFNEGYSSTQPDRLIRTELCEEAVRLALLLAEHPLTSGSNSAAFLALLLFHASRLDARLDDHGAILLFGQQELHDWDLRLLREAFKWFEQATTGSSVSRYHAEAMIAAEHCRGKLTGATDWASVLSAYDLLCNLAPSPVHELNRAIAMAHHRGAAAGLECMRRIDGSRLADNYYLWHATMGELHMMSGDHPSAQRCLRRAWELAPTQAEKELVCQKIDGLE
ncbi:MAG: sigma-70 family RNA polymerase sigma factor [Planctomycetota bacterium]